MEWLYFIAAFGCAISAYAIINLWRHRTLPGALPCAWMFFFILIHLIAISTPNPPLLFVQIGLLSIVMFPPLLLTALIEYTGMPIARWPLVRWLVIATPLGLSLFLILFDDQGVLASLAAEPELAVRIEMLRDIRDGYIAPVTYMTYAFTLMIFAVAGWQIVTTPKQRPEMLAVMLIPALVTVFDLSYHIAGTTIFGILPTPIALILGLAVLGLVLQRTRMFDLRPVARSVLIDNVKDCMLVVDEQQRVVDCNHAAELFLGRRQQDIIGVAMDHLEQPELTLLLHSRAHLRQEIATRRNDTRHWLEVDVTPLVIKGKDCGRLVIARDISERRMAEEALQQSREQLQQANAQLLEQSITDPLTSLRNRRFLFDRLHEEVRRQRRNGTTLGLLIIDIDHFKAVNDTHGHPVGDDALRHVATVLLAIIRGSDVAARLGGEEFAVMAMDTDPDGVALLAERIRQAIAAQPVQRPGEPPLKLTVSIGGCFTGDDDAGPDRLFAEADRYLYLAKNAGRDRVAVGPPQDAGSALLPADPHTADAGR